MRAIYRGYCPLEEPEMAIHATNLLYDIALLPSCSSPTCSISLHSLLALTLIPLRSFIFAIMASCIFFSCVIVGVRKRVRVLYSAPYGSYGEIADSLAINPSLFTSSIFFLHAITFFSYLFRLYLIKKFSI